MNLKEYAQQQLGIKTEPVNEYAIKAPDCDYDSIDAIRNSELNYVEKSPAHWHAYKQGLIKSTPAMLTGTQLHLAVLEPEKFNELWTIKEDARSKNGKLINQVNLDAGKILLSETDFETYLGIISSLSKSEFVRTVLHYAECEKTLMWGRNGLKFKAKIDCFLNWGKYKVLGSGLEYGAIIDFKFVRDAEPNSFIRSAEKYGYDRQLAFYAYGARINRIINSEKQFKCFIIAVEKTPPYAFSIIELSEETLMLGKMKYEKLIKDWQSIQEINNFPSYGQKIW
jgi:hypothetical protein